MKKILIFLSLSAMLVACGPTDSERAMKQIDEARVHIARGELQQAHIILDSVHILYPTEVAQRRVASALEDSIKYIENKRSLAYSDSLLQILLPKVDPLLKNFNYEKANQYEDNGRYVHRLLNTDRNTSHSFLQAYVLDNRETIVKSYYYGSSSLNHTIITLRSEGVDLSVSGENYSFNSGGNHEILSLSSKESLDVLNFISSHISASIEVVQQGEKSNHFRLNKEEKEALSQSYQLGLLMKDIHQLEEQIRVLQAHIFHYEQ